MTRHLLAALALICLAIAGWAWITGRPDVAGVTGRVGAVLGAVWIAWPSLTKVDARTYLMLGLGVGVVMWRPRAAWLVLPVLAIVFSRRRDR